MKREDVEALYQEARENGGSIGHVDSTHLAALCRAWLAVDGAPVALMGMDCVLYGNPSPLVALNGQRVRIVPVEGDQ